MKSVASDLNQSHSFSNNYYSTQAMKQHSNLPSGCATS